MNALCCFAVRQGTNSSLGHLSVEVSRSHTIRHTHTHDRTPLDDWLGRRRGRYLVNATHNKHTRTSMPSAPFEHEAQQSSGRRPTLRPHGHRDWPIETSHVYILETRQIRLQGMSLNLATWRPDCWQKSACSQEDLRPASSIKIFCGLPYSENKCWFGTQIPHCTASFSSNPLKFFHNAALPKPT
jgi:hypothetical protein